MDEASILDKAESGRDRAPAARGRAAGATDQPSFRRESDGVASPSPKAGSRAERPSRRSRKTRRDLIVAAKALLEEQGVNALTVKAVTARADVGHGTFYHHFTSTEDVLAAGIEDSMREFSAEMERDYTDAADKAWVFVESTARTFRMLAAHPALGWMLERPHLLTTALREACGPFALRDLEAMAAAGEVRDDILVRATRYWDWIFLGALVDAAAHPQEKQRVEESLVEIVLRILAVKQTKIDSLLERLRTGDKAVSRKGTKA